MQPLSIDKNKQHIRRCFNKAALTYDHHNVLQEWVGKQLITLLQKHCQQPKKMLDLGCGSGVITEQLARQFQYELFQALDISDRLLLQARQRLNTYPVELLEGDFDFWYAENTFDLAFSNMALQWSAYLDKAFAITQKNLAADGILAFSLPVAGTFAELNQVAKNNFYTPEAIVGLLHKNHFTTLECLVTPMSFNFDSLYAAVKTLKAVGANFVFNKTHKALRGKNFLHDLTNTQDMKNFVFTYVIGFFIARKNPCQR